MGVERHRVGRRDEGDAGAGGGFVQEIGRRGREADDTDGQGGEGYQDEKKDDEPAIVADAGDVDGVDDPDRGEAESQMAGSGEQSVARRHAGVGQRVAEEGAEGDEAHGGGDARPPDEMQDEAERRVEGAHGPDIGGAGARHGAREAGVEKDLQEDDDAGREHGEGHEVADPGIDADALGDHEIDPGAIFLRHRRGDDGGEAEGFFQAISRPLRAHAGLLSGGGVLGVKTHHAAPGQRQHSGLRALQR